MVVNKLVRELLLVSKIKIQTKSRSSRYYLMGNLKTRISMKVKILSLRVLILTILFYMYKIDIN